MTGVVQGTIPECSPPKASVNKHCPCVPASPCAGSFRNRSADFLWMLLFGGTLLTLMAPLASIEFLGSSLTFMMVYVWGRRHPYVTLSFLGIFTFTAPYLPWVLLGFSLMLGSSPKVDLLGMVAGGWELWWGFGGVEWGPACVDGGGMFAVRAVGLLQ